MGWFDRFKSPAREQRLESEALDYKGFKVQATLKPESGQYRVCGRITKDGRSREFIRSDLIPELDMAEQITIGKATLIIDQHGEQVFEVAHI